MKEQYLIDLLFVIYMNVRTKKVKWVFKGKDKVRMNVRTAKVKWVFKGKDKVRMNLRTAKVKWVFKGKDKVRMNLRIVKVKWAVYPRINCSGSYRAITSTSGVDIIFMRGGA